MIETVKLREKIITPNCGLNCSKLLKSDRTRVIGLCNVKDKNINLGNNDRVFCLDLSTIDESDMKGSLGKIVPKYWFEDSREYIDISVSSHRTFVLESYRVTCILNRNMTKVSSYEIPPLPRGTARLVSSDDKYVYIIYNASVSLHNHTSLNQLSSVDIPLLPDEARNQMVNSRIYKTRHHVVFLCVITVSTMYILAACNSKIHCVVSALYSINKARGRVFTPYYDEYTDDICVYGEMRHRRVSHIAY